jgi:hypothetical protein
MILVVAEYLSDKDKEGALTSPIGHVFRGWMRQAGIDERDCLFTSVLQHGTLAQALTKDKSLIIKGMKPVMGGNYLLASRMPDIERLKAFVTIAQPNVIIALGDLALWALTSEKSLKFARGRITAGLVPGTKVLPTYSPMQVMSEYSVRPILLADLGKAKRESAFRELRRPQRFLHIAPTLLEMEAFLQEYLVGAESLSVDIETKGPMITCVGFAPNKERALVVPFFDAKQPDGNYWRTRNDERLAWAFVERVLKQFKSFGQNFQYDMQYLWRYMGIASSQFCDDTMLMHHSLQPEMQKGLGFLASVYTDELAWKFMHKVKASDKAVKKGDTE